MRVRAAVRRADRSGSEREAGETSSQGAGTPAPESAGKGSVDPTEQQPAAARLQGRTTPDPPEPDEQLSDGHAGEPQAEHAGGRQARHTGDEQVDGAGEGQVEHVGEDEMPNVRLTRRQLLAFGLFAVSIVAFLYLVLPKLAGVGQDVKRIEKGDKWWVAIGVAFEIVSFGGYVVLFRTVFARGPSRISWRVSYQITMAGLVATRLFAAAGAGGIALTAWALRRSGMPPRLVACRMVAFMVLLYAVYAASLLIDGVALATGAFPGGGSFAITVVPAIAGFVLFAVTGAIALLPKDLERRLHAWAEGPTRMAHVLNSTVAAPALAASGVRTAMDLIRERRLGVLGAIVWWTFDILVLWAMFHAFGTPPPLSVIWMCYFVGTLANLLPLPGGLGGVEGGMIGAFAAFGVSFDLAVLAVLSYRAISFWLPTIPGGIAYFQLRKTVAQWKLEQGSSASGPVPAVAGQAGALQSS